MALPSPKQRTKKHGNKLPQTAPISDNKGIDGHTMKNTKTLVWQPQTQPKHKTKEGDNWYSSKKVYASFPNEDERLLPNFRGKNL